MTGQPKTESWSIGGAYEPFIGRWSRRIAGEFVRWLPREDGRTWLELGPGLGRARPSRRLTRTRAGRKLCTTP